MMKGFTKGGKFRPTGNSSGLKSGQLLTSDERISKAIKQCDGLLEDLDDMKNQVKELKKSRGLT